MTDPRLDLADVIAKAEQAKADLEQTLGRLGVVETKTRKPHLCHVCGKKTREDS